MYSDSFAPIKTVEIKKSPKTEPKVEPVKVVESPEAEAPKPVQQPKVEPVKPVVQTKVEVPKKEEPKVEVKPEKIVVDWNKPYEDMTIEELQEAILEKMRRNGPVTEYMLGTVRENTHHGSLVTWVRSFN